MQLVSFSFRSEVTAEQQTAVLDRIGQWDSVVGVMPLKSGAKHPSIRRMFYAYVNDEADVAATVDQLSSLPEVGSAAVPAKRYLAV